MTSRANPARQVVAVTPHNTTQYLGDAAFRGFIPNTDGNVTVDARDVGTNVAIPCVKGNIYPIEVTRIYATGTDSTVVIGLR